MSSEQKRHRSGFPMLDLLTGGYPAGSIVAVRYLGHECQADIVQKFMLRQAASFAVRDDGPGLKTLLVSLQMGNEDILRSFIMEKAVPADVLARSSLYVSGTVACDPGAFFDELDGYVRECRPRALIIDAVDKVIPKGDVAAQNAASRTVLAALLRLTEEDPIPVIVTDYGNVWETAIPYEPRVVDLELNEDARRTVQATFHERKRSVVIDDLFGDYSSPGLELVRAAASSENFVPPACTGDEVSVLASAAALAIRRIDEILGKSLRP